MRSAFQGNGMPSASGGGLFLSTRFWTSLGSRRTSTVQSCFYHVRTVVHGKSHHIDAHGIPVEVHVIELLKICLITEFLL